MVNFDTSLILSDDEISEYLDTNIHYNVVGTNEPSKLLFDNFRNVAMNKIENIFNTDFFLRERTEVYETFGSDEICLRTGNTNPDNISIRFRNKRDINSQYEDFQIENYRVEDDELQLDRCYWDTQFEITYTAGYSVDEYPEDIKRLFLLLIVNYYLINQSTKQLKENEEPNLGPIQLRIILTENIDNKRKLIEQEINQIIIARNCPVRLSRI